MSTYGNFVFHMSKGAGDIMPGTALNDFVCYAPSNTQNIFIGSSNASNILVITNSNTTTSNMIVTGTTTTSNLNITGNVVALSNITTSNIFTSNATISNVTIASTVTFPTNFNVSTGTGVLTTSGAFLQALTTASNVRSSNVTTTTCTLSNMWASNVTLSNATIQNTATFSNINFTGTLTQNGTAFVSGSSGGTSGSNASFSNLIVTNSLTLGSNTVSFGAGTTAQITASTWSYMQNYVYSATGANAGPAISSTLMTGVASQHSAIIQSGQLYVYGNNSNGQLGLGNTTAAPIPTMVPMLSNVVAVACGQQFTVVLNADSNVYAMGANSFGQLGSNTGGADQLTPFKVPLLSNVVQIATGAIHAMYLTSGNTLWGTGCGTQGQLATNTGSVNSSAVAIPLPYVVAVGNSNAVLTIDAGLYHSALVLNNGTLYTWGQNSYGQLANSNLTASDATIVTTPQGIAGFPATVSLACGMFHTVWADSNGSVYTVGRNDFGQLGNGTTANLTVPAKVVTGPGPANIVTLLAAGRAHTAMVKNTGTMWTWGDNSFGQLGKGSAVTQQLTPTQLLLQYSAPATAYAVAAGAYNTTFLLNNDMTVAQKNRIVACGQNQFGQVGNAMYSPNGQSYSSNVYVPVPITPSVSMYRKQLFAGCTTMSSAYIDVDGTLYTWGNNNYGQLGDGSTTNRFIPSALSYFNLTGARIIALACGYDHSMALDSKGAIYTWGNNGLGQLGNGTNTTSYIPSRVIGGGITSSTVIVAIACGYQHTMALDSTGAIYTWGANGSGQLGNGTTTTTTANNYPAKVNGNGASGNQIYGSTVIVAIACGFYHSVALDSLGAIYNWGNNSVGQLGNGSSGTDVFVPTKVTTISGIVAIACGQVHTIALDSTGAIYTWGYNEYGQIGNNTTSAVVYQKTPLKINGYGSITNSTVIVAIACGNQHTMALDSTGAIYTWGYNGLGQLGINSTSMQSTPQLVTLNNRKIYQTMFSVGGLGDHKLIRWPHGGIAANVLRVVGANSYGQLGTGNTTAQANILTLSTSTFPAGSSITSHANGNFHSGVVLSTGAVYLWGRNDYGQCGVAGGANVLTPAVFNGTPNGTSVCCGSNCTFIVSNGVVSALGMNSANQLGINSATASFVTAQTMSFPVFISQVVSGGGASLALSSAGELYSWGTNTYGSTGQGTTTGTTATPTLVSPLAWNSFPVTAIAMGDGIAAIIANNDLYTCGINTEGGLGLATNFGTATPVSTFTKVPIQQSYDVVSVVCGQRHMVVQLANNSIITFGRNTAGQLGNTFGQNSTLTYVAGTNTYTPTIPAYNVANPPIQISATANSSLEERFDNTTKSYGATVGKRTVLMKGSSLHLMTALVTPSGALYTWGRNVEGQLGRGDALTPQTTPILINTGSNPLNGKTIVAIACGSAHTMALDSTGAIYTWGYNGYGQLGNGGATPYVPTKVTTISDVVDIACGDNHSMALDSTGAIYTWGNNSVGQLGNGSSGVVVTTPAKITITGNPVIVAITCGQVHTMALDSTGAIYTWGYNEYGQIGNNTTSTVVYQKTPLKINGYGSITNSTVIVAIACGYQHTMALDSTGAIYTWGYNNTGQLGNGTTTTANNSPAKVNGNGASGNQIFGSTVIVAIACGYYHSMALDSTGAIYTWGGNSSGQLGNGGATPYVPTKVTTISGIVAIACGQAHTMALDSTGAIYTWGNNSEGQLGINSTTNQNTPQSVTSATYLPLATTAPVAISFTPFFVNFTGQHRVFVAGKVEGESEGFIVVCDQNDYITANGAAAIGEFSRGKKAITINDALPIVSLAKRAYDKRVFGVLSPVVERLSPNMEGPDAQGHRQLAVCGDVRMEVNAIGEGAIWVCDATGPLTSGDLITSSEVPGYGQLQAGDLPDVVRSFTVAKITCDCDFTAPLKPVLVIEKDENGLNVVDPVTGWPKWIQQMKTVMIDPATNAAADYGVTREPEEQAAWQATLVATEEVDMEPSYEMRYLLPDGARITEAEYLANIANGVPCHRAAFVGCTYHCG